MVETIIFFVFTIFAVAGICEFLYILTVIFSYPGYRCNNYSIVILKKGHSIRQLNFFWQKLKWRGNDFAKGIIAVTDKIEYEELLMCRDFIPGKDIILCDSDALTQVIFNTLGE